MSKPGAEASGLNIGMMWVQLFERVFYGVVRNHFFFEYVGSGLGDFTILITFE